MFRTEQVQSPPRPEKKKKLEEALADAMKNKAKERLDQYVESGGKLEDLRDHLMAEREEALGMIKLLQNQKENGHGEAGLALIDEKAHLQMVDHQLELIKEMSQ